MAKKNTLEELGREKIKSLLSQCTKEQVEIFNKMYKSADHITLNKMDWAIQQIERTIEKNNERSRNMLR